MNKKIIISIGIVVAAIIVAIVLVMSMQKPSAAPSSEATDTTTPDTVATATITYGDNGFSPKSLSVKAGDTIKIVNESSVPLEFSSDSHPTHTHDPELNMSVIEPGKDGILKVTRTGTWGYHNHQRSGDTGSLTVSE